MRNSTRPEDRFWLYCDRSDMSGCWIWTGSLNTGGYGQIKQARSNKKILAHRLSYQINRGPIPDGAVVLHKCDNTRCVNPDHLFLGTQSDNMLDAMRKGRLKEPPLAAKERMITHCPRGHEYSKENTRIYKGIRYCLRCINERNPLRKNA